MALPVTSQTIFVAGKRNRFYRSKANIKSGKPQRQSEKSIGEISCDYTYLQKTASITQAI